MQLLIIQKTLKGKVKKSMKNVLILPADFYPMSTGFANATLNLVKAINKHNNEICLHIFTDTELNDNDEIEDNIVIRYKNKGKNNLFWLIVNSYMKFDLIKRYVQINNIDLILLETNTFPILQNLLLSEFPNKLAVRVHSTADTEVLVFNNNYNLIGKILRYLTIKFMNDVKFIISTNKYHLDFVKKYILQNNVYNIWQNKEYFVLPNTCAEFAPMKRNKNERYILTLGKMSENGYVQKGLQDVIKAIYFMKIKNILPADFKLKLIGDGVMRSNIISYSHSLEVDNYIEFIKDAPHDEVLNLINGALAVVLLSRYEGQSMFITETISLGKPVLITIDNGMKDMISNLENGLVVETGNFESAANAIKKIYEMDNNSLAIMEDKSKEIYKKNFAPEIVAENFSNILDMIMARD